MENAIPAHKDYLLSHYQQRFNWDCGLSCILMILPKRLRKNFLNDFENICTNGGFGHSTWTIDLCYILKDFNIPHKLLTKTLGVDPSYGEHSYYQNIISQDENRINRKMKEAKIRGIDVQKKTIGIDHIIRHLGQNGPIIMLTNSALLICDICRPSRFFSRTRYTGHYVVACGYDMEKKKLKYRNPAKEDHLCITSFDSMQNARVAYGTDEDTILIFYPK